MPRHDVIAHGDVPPQVLRRARRLVAQHGHLRDALMWGATQRPPRHPAAVVVQDESTHDVVFAFERGFHLAYDVT